MDKNTGQKVTIGTPKTPNAPKAPAPEATPSKDVTPQPKGASVPKKTTPENGVSKKEPLIAVLFETALKYNGINFKKNTDSEDIVFTWDVTTPEDKVVYEIVIHPDASFATSAKVNSINTTRTLNFNNARESQNIVVHALTNLQKNNEG